MSSRFEVVETRDGPRAMRDRQSGELMHPVGPLVEATTLYVEPARLVRRLVEGPITLFDVGLGAGSNAAAAWRASEARPAGHPLRIISFDRTADALALALAPEHAAAFGFDPRAAAAASAVLRDGAHATDRTSWRLILDDLPGSLARAGGRADIVFWDPFSPKASPELWNIATFTALRAACAERATVHTFGTATSTRAALLLSGFAVGRGPAIGRKTESTIAALDRRDLDAPLDRRWLERFLRSSAPLPADAPEDATAKIVGTFG